MTHKFADEIWEKLLDIKTYQYTREEVEKLLGLITKRKQDRETLKAMSVVQLWKNNLSEL